MNENEKYKIEDFWPDAEKMLDQHFESKKGFGFKFGLISLLVLMVGGVCAWYFLSSGSSELNTLAVDSKSKTEVSSSSYIKNTDLPSNNVTATSNSIATETTSNSVQKSTENIETKSVFNSNKPNQQKQANINESGVSKTSEETINTNTTGSLNNVNKTKTITPFSNGVGSSASTITADESSSKEENFNKSTSPNINNNTNSIKHSAQKSNIVVNTTNSANALIKSEIYHENKSEYTATTKESNVSLNKLSPIKNSNSKLSPNNAVEQQALLVNEIVWLSPIKPNLTQQYPLLLNALPIALETSYGFQSKTNKKPIISYQIGAGLFNVSKTLSASTNQDYVDRRNAEEKTANYASWMLGAKVQYQRFAINTGVELNKYGENVTYSNWLLGNTSNVTNTWNYIADSVTSVSNYYIQGNQFDQTNTQVITDSTLVSDTTTVYGQKSADVSGINSKTMISYIEIPLVLEYEAIKTKRFSVALRTGVSVGFMSQKRGFYLDKTQEEFRDLNSISTFRSTVWNARFGADFSYFIVPKTSVFIRPEYRTNLQSIFKTEAGIQQKYRAFGVMIGLSKSF